MNKEETYKDPLQFTQDELNLIGTSLLVTYNSMIKQANAEENEDRYTATVNMFETLFKKINKITAFSEQDNQ
ncbi:MAG: hypothetical protein GY845_25825 [Planctomycetes bacterium]|nr:hypothetical protein [Planctomycetota bacterium]